MMRSISIPGMSMSTHTSIHTLTDTITPRPRIGHLEAVKHMVEDGRDCSEVLVQLAAVRSALNNTAKIILKDHLEHCITASDSSAEQLAEMNDAIDRFI